MILPTGIFASMTTMKISSYWPYVSYDVSYWITIGLVYCAAFVVILPAVLRGKTLYRYVRWQLPWHFLYVVGNVLFLSIMIVLFMSMWCDYSSDPATFIQDPTMQCYKSKHMIYAILGFVTLSIATVQHVLLPVGSFKETITENLDIVYTPKYLSLHTLLKIIYAGIYVFFYDINLIRIPALTLITILMLWFNSRISPCCITKINLLRDMVFGHASMAGVMGTAYLFYEDYWNGNTSIDSNSNTKWLYLYILGTYM